MKTLKWRIHALLRKSERYFKTDMVYMASGHFWLTASRGVAMTSGFMLTIALANLFTPTELGIYKYVLAIAGILGAFTLNGIPSAVMRAIGKGNPNVIPGVFRAGLLWSTPSSTFAVLVGGYYFLNGNNQLGIAFLIIAATNPVLSNLGVTKVLFNSTGDFKQAAIYAIPRTTLPILIIIMTLFVTHNVLIVLSSYFLSNTLIGWYFYRLSLKKLSIKDEPKYVNETVRYAKHQSIIGGIQAVVSYADQILLWHLLGPVHLAIYTIASGPLKEMRTLVDNLTLIIFPKIAQKKAAVATQAVPYRTKQLFLLLVGAIVLYVITAPLLFKVFFPQYLSAILISQLLMVSLLFQPRNLADALIFAHGSIQDRYLAILPGTLLKLLLVLLLIPPFGLMGAVTAMTLSELGNTLFMVYAYKRFSKVHTV